MDTRTTPDGGTVFIAREETLRGSKGPFLRAYQTPSKERPYGFLCSNCDTLNNTMDTMGRIVCNECGNTKKADEWDAAHE